MCRLAQGGPFETRGMGWVRGMAVAWLQGVKTNSPVKSSNLVSHCPVWNNQNAGDGSGNEFYILGWLLAAGK